MLSTREVQAALAGYTLVEWQYDGLGGSVIQWTFEHGNTNEDPSVLGWILDPDGNETAAGVAHLGSATAMVKWLEEHKKAGFPLVDPTQFSVLNKEAANIAARRKMGEALARARKLAAGGAEVSAEAVSEAERLIAAIEPYARFKLERASALETSAPARALELYKEIAAEFKGDTIGTDADATFDRLRKDKAFMAEVAGFEIIAKVEALADEMKPCKGTRRLELDTCAECQTKNKTQLDSARATLQALIKKQPNSAAARAATALAQQWKLGL